MAEYVFAGLTFGLVVRKMILMRRKGKILSTVTRAAFDIGAGPFVFMPTLTMPAVNCSNLSLAHEQEVVPRRLSWLAFCSAKMMPLRFRKSYSKGFRTLIYVIT